MTKNVRTELLNDDWSVMILHYLGLDHIGHVEGPQGKHIKPKLKEMDDVIEYIYKNLIKMVKLCFQVILTSKFKKLKLIS